MSNLSSLLKTGLFVLQGTQGTQGIQGRQGIQGIQGTQGVQGITGIKGNTKFAINYIIVDQ